MKESFSQYLQRHTQVKGEFNLKNHSIDVISVSTIKCQIHLSWNQNLLRASKIDTTTKIPAV